MQVQLFLFVLSFSSITSIVAVPKQQQRDRISALPGQPPVAFPQYYGYVTVNERDGRSLFYWLIEATESPQKKPLVLWLNGGPGCSSIAYGALQELGPFLLKTNDTQLILNKLSWNKGFSYTNKSEDLHKLGDQVTANDSHAFLMGWFKRFPQFQGHDFYLTGESYAGHYVPQLAELIYERNKGASKDSYINLKGFMIGNAVINDPTDTSGFVDYTWSHAIISDQLYNNIKKECDFSNSNQTINCSAHLRSSMKAYSDIDIYSIYSPVCLNYDASRTRPKLVVAPRLLTQHNHWHRLPSGYDPCTDDYIETYFNREDVQRTLHANVTKLSYPYTRCSGDTDGRVPVTSTRYSINKMGLKIKEEWRAWFHKRQVAGWVETYQSGLTFATVRGAGHEVPLFRPDQSLSLFTHFLSAKTLPSSRF